MIFNDDAPYLREWIEYHQMMGVEHFYLYNHMSTDNYREVLQPYIEKGLVELMDWPFSYDTLQLWDKIQKRAYTNALKKAKRKAKWLAIMDSDEFFVPVECNHLHPLLKKYDKNKIGGIRGSWVMFGTSGVERIPEDGLLIELVCLNEDRVHVNVKSIVRPERVDFVESVHWCKYRTGCSAPLLSIHELQVNHYWTRTEDFMLNHKIPRRAKMGYSTDHIVPWNDSAIYFNTYSERILKFIPELKRRMGLL
jgi:hypothetical protein